MLDSWVFGIYQIMPLGTFSNLQIHSYPRTIRISWAAARSQMTPQLSRLVPMAGLGMRGSLQHSSVLAWRIPGTGEPGGLPSMGSHRVGHD